MTVADRDCLAEESRESQLPEDENVNFGTLESDGDSSGSDSASDDVSGSDSTGNSSDSKLESEGESKPYGFRLIDLVCLELYFQPFVAHAIYHGPVSLFETQREGLASCLKVSCSNCDSSTSQFMPKKVSSCVGGHKESCSWYASDWLFSSSHDQADCCIEHAFPHESIHKFFACQRVTLCCKKRCSD